MLCLVSLTYAGGAIGVFSSAKYEPIYNGSEHSNKVSIMINVYMGTEFIDPILKVLEEKNAKATFFVGGIWVSKNAQCLQKIYNSGHEIGNHGYWHKDHKNISREQNYNEIKLCHDLVKQTIDYDMTLFAPPSGSFSSATIEIASNLGYKSIMWSKDTIDWRDQNSTQFIERSTKNGKSGDYILMHPTKCTAENIGKVIDYYQNKNIKLETVSNNLPN